jgi:hypothetical protein
VVLHLRIGLLGISIAPDSGWCKVFVIGKK